MSSQEVVDYCYSILGDGIASRDDDNNDDLIKKEMAQHLVSEALRRGSMDNISVAVIWLTK